MTDARFRKVGVSMWGDERFQELSAPPPNAQTLWIYLLTNEDTTSIPGLYRAREGGIADALKWPIDALRRCFAEIVKAKMARADWRAGLVYIPNAFKYDPPANANVIKGWKRLWAELPQCALKVDAYRELGAKLKRQSPAMFAAFVAACGNGMPNGSPNSMPNGMPNQEQEQEQEQEQDLDLHSVEGSTDLAQEEGSEPPAPPAPSPEALMLAIDVEPGDTIAEHPTKKASAKTKRMVIRHRDAAMRVLAAISVARQRINPRNHGIPVNYQTLSMIAERLEDGYTEDDCMHVVAVLEAQAKADPDKFRWLSESSGFRIGSFKISLDSRVKQTRSISGPMHQDSWDDIPDF